MLCVVSMCEMTMRKGHIPLIRCKVSRFPLAMAAIQLTSVEVAANV